MQKQGSEEDNRTVSSEETLIASEGLPKPVYTVAVVIVVSIIALGAIITSSVIFLHTGGTVPFDYGVVIDAGSTHTQTLLYKWLGSKDNGTGDVTQLAECTFDGGISSLPDPAVIVKCVQNVTDYIPSSAKSPPLYLGATAGMRLLNLTQPDIVRLILLELKCSLQKFKVDVREVDVIPGINEGVYSWITVNLLKKVLDPREDSLQHKVPSDHWHHTYGSLDMGGASTQIAFAVHPDDSKKFSNTSSMKLYGHKYDVLSNEFLCFGAVQAFHRHQALLVNTSLVMQRDSPITDPCLPKGNRTVVNAEALLGGPCTSTPEFESWLQKKENRMRNFTFEGSSDVNKCKEIVEELTNSSSCSNKGFHPCPEKITLPQDMKFMAFSSFYYVTAFLNATNVSLHEFLVVTTHWCGMSWEDMTDHPIKPKIFSHLTQYCFGALYIAKWLTGIYGFYNETWHNIIFQQQVDSSELGWALGLMVNATNALPEEAPSPPYISTTVFVIILLGSVFMLIFGMVLLHQYCRNRSSPKNLSYRQFGTI